MNYPPILLEIMKWGIAIIISYGLWIWVNKYFVKDDDGNYEYDVL